MSELEMDLFDFAASQAQNCPADDSAELPETGEKTVPELSHAALQQAALAFMVSLNPEALAVNVPTRTAKFRATAAGLWRHAGRKGNTITRTALVVMYEDIGHCFADCAGREERLKKIASLQEEKTALEALIRMNEPHLAAADDLFSEFRTWDYASSENREYHRLCRKLKRELDEISHGSKLERIRRAGVADQCYLALPRNMAEPELIPEEWGVVELFPELPRFRLLREAAYLSDITPSARASFAVRIAASAAEAVRFCNGVDRSGALRKLPRRRGRINGKLK